MTNPERNPVEQWCQSGSEVAVADRPEVEVLTAREVPLGGPRAMTVRRTLPQRQRSLIGAWCFADHYGPDDVSVAGGMDVAPHPHTGLQTVSWLFSGEIEHRDSLGMHAYVRPGEVNLMTGGHGICHSEVSTPATTVLHGVQLWLALPDSDRHAPRNFEHHVPEPSTSRRDAAGVPRVAGRQHLAGGHLHAAAGRGAGAGAWARLELPIDPRSSTASWSTPAASSCAAARGERGAGLPGDRAPDRDGREPNPTPSRVVILGGEPFDEEIVMWWNFVGRSHDEIVAFREAWQSGSDQFGEVAGYRARFRGCPRPRCPTLGSSRGARPDRVVRADSGPLRGRIPYSPVRSNLSAHSISHRRQSRRNSTVSSTRTQSKSNSSHQSTTSTTAAPGLDTSTYGPPPAPWNDQGPTSGASRVAAPQQGRGPVRQRAAPSPVTRGRERGSIRSPRSGRWRS